MLKVASGGGTFFAVVLTGGMWLLALPFYAKRCVICGLQVPARRVTPAPQEQVAGPRY